MQDAKIKVIGLGGAGNNAVNRMIESGLEGVEFIAGNTDAQVLAKSRAGIRLQLGDRLTRGLGAGADPSVGEKAALEDREVIKDHLQGTDMLFVTAGMGGGTGTGSAPVVAEIAREMGILTIGIVTRPFKFEGPKRMRMAEEGLAKLADRVDGMIVVNNEKLLTAVDKKVSFREAFLIADRVLYFGVKGISDVINVEGMINLDFADVRNLLAGSGTVLMGIGSGRGEKMAEDAALSAIHSPLLERGIEGAHRILVNVTGGYDLGMSEANDIVEKIRAATGNEDPDILFGITPDESAGDEVRVTVIATGFQESRSPLIKPARGGLDGLVRAAPRPAVNTMDYEIPAFLRYTDPAN
ncbi:cell division protein FtsZ [Deinococcus soli (ex Cha et al. 2016)]|uniref:Cell division protein FtsZ n=2 Tax=Deinococcus soli (ex Cha et al. 2016) TaxID=1309411 RepID=A0ACC6KGQ8_9DEIO|nr:cell division protein FtsZ [Deinococcus soli (ex Cha et al. 2016)]MDR6218138.1 cell division protein FtsZ [Deinococcus soli (ex Cha et al. 2016)]MDR6328878.1 cell division protein FtsZ [Deinococcus soli (ex Cha et al. 2016)]MDR6751634.1 cell division protein FtsZ [Deinococcus soli (ex Cha et al. 2016)]